MRRSSACSNMKIGKKAEVILQLTGHLPCNWLTWGKPSIPYDFLGSDSGITSESRAKSKHLPSLVCPQNRKKWMNTCVLGKRLILLVILEKLRNMLKSTDMLKTTKTRSMSHILCHRSYLCWRKSEGSSIHVISLALLPLSQVSDTLRM